MRRRTIHRSLPRRGQRPISEPEQTRRARQREQALAAVPVLLYSRRQTSRALGGISIAKIIRIENAGLLDKVVLAGVPNGQVYHRVEQVERLAQGGDHAAE
jgi:hypothetical protein